MSGANPFLVQARGWFRYGERTRGTQAGFYPFCGKRMFDALAASFGLVVASPLLAIAAIAVRLDSPGPVFFRQVRVGQNNRRFAMFKFRTMVHRRQSHGLRITAVGDPRITRTGRLLRKSKLDELPQLFNVLRGEMSLVGPRPEVPEYVALYDAAQTRILDLKPGITSLASLTFHDEEALLAGREDRESFYVGTLLPRKLAYDLPYRENIRFLTDLRIIFATLANLLRSRFRAFDSTRASSTDSRAGE